MLSHLLVTLLSLYPIRCLSPRCASVLFLPLYCPRTDLYPSRAADYQGMHLALLRRCSTACGTDHLNTPSRAHTQETERLVADPAPGITALPHDDNLRYFDVTIEGPDGSPFQREPFLLSLFGRHSQAMKEVYSSWNCSCLKNTLWHRQR